LQGILNTTIPAAITERASPVAPGINFNLHSIIIQRKGIMGKGKGGEAVGFFPVRAFCYTIN
jgi:hypothetical protein